MEYRNFLLLICSREPFDTLEISHLPWFMHVMAYIILKKYVIHFETHEFETTLYVFIRNIVKKGKRIDILPIDFFMSYHNTLHIQNMSFQKKKEKRRKKKYLQIKNLHIIVFSPFKGNNFYLEGYSYIIQKKKEKSRSIYDGQVRWFILYNDVPLHNNVYM